MIHVIMYGIEKDRNDKGEWITCEHDMMLTPPTGQCLLLLNPSKQRNKQKQQQKAEPSSCLLLLPESVPQ